MKLRNVVLAITLVCVSCALRAADDPLAGSWKLNVAKSQFGANPPRSSIVKREALPNGFKSTTDTVEPNGDTLHYTYTAYYDGKDYPVDGDPGRDMVSMKRVSPNIVDTVSKKAGKVTTQTRLRVAPDGKTMTITIKSKNAQGADQTRVQFYDKM